MTIEEDAALYLGLLKQIAKELGPMAYLDDNKGNVQKDPPISKIPELVRIQKLLSWDSAICWLRTDYCKILDNGEDPREEDSIKFLTRAQERFYNNPDDDFIPFNIDIDRIRERYENKI